MKVKYIGPARDYSGYGEANRHDIAALLEGSIGVTTKLPRYTLEIADFGELGQKVMQTENFPLAYDVVIHHTTPNEYVRYIEPDKYNIGRVFWETDKLPEDFAKGANLCNEIWTGSKFNVNAIRKAGVTKPIFIIPEAVDTTYDFSKIEPYIIGNKDDFKFYSIFEWTERKNPIALLTAFWKEFENTEGVSLTLKTYMDNFTPDKKNEIDSSIRIIKKKLGLTRYAPVYLYKNLMDRSQVYRFHKTFDCFVSAHRGEGWGIPQMEALLVGNPIISTNLGGLHEYLTNVEDALLINYKMVPVSNSRNTEWYKPDQNWGEIDQTELRTAMRATFEHRDKAKEMGISGQNKIRKLFSLKEVGQQMRKRLLEIDTKILYPVNETLTS